MQIKVTLPSGETTEVDASALALPEGAQILAPGATPEGFVSKEYHDSRLADTGRDDAARLKQAKQQLRQDAEFRSEIAAAVKAEAAPDTEAAITAAREKWEADVLKPVQDRLDTFQSNLKRETVLSTLAALKDDDGRPLVRDEFLRRVGDAPSYAETVFGSFVDLGDDGRPRAVDGEGKPLPSSEAGRAYASPAQHFRRSSAPTPTPTCGRTPRRARADRASAGRTAPPRAARSGPT